MSTTRRRELLPEPRLHIALHMLDGPSCEKCYCLLQTHKGPLRARGGGTTNAPDCTRQIARGPVTRTRRETTQTETPTQRPDHGRKEHRQETFGPLLRKKKTLLSPHPLPPSSLQKNNIRTTSRPPSPEKQKMKSSNKSSFESEKFKVARK